MPSAITCDGIQTKEVLNTASASASAISVSNYLLYTSQPSAHTGWEPSTRATAKCDLCHKQRCGTIQKCSDCKLSICKQCCLSGRLRGDERHALDPNLANWGTHSAPQTRKVNGTRQKKLRRDSLVKEHAEKRLRTKRSNTQKHGIVEPRSLRSMAVAPIMAPDIIPEPEPTVNEDSLTDIGQPLERQLQTTVDAGQSTMTTIKRKRSMISPSSQLILNRIDSCNGGNDASVPPYQIVGSKRFKQMHTLNTPTTDGAAVSPGDSNRHAPYQHKSDGKAYPSDSDYNVSQDFGLGHLSYLTDPPSIMEPVCPVAPMSHYEADSWSRVFNSCDTLENSNSVGLLESHPLNVSYGHNTTKLNPSSYPTPRHWYVEGSRYTHPNRHPPPTFAPHSVNIPTAPTLADTSKGVETKTVSKLGDWPRSNLVQILGTSITNTTRILKRSHPERPMDRCLRHEILRTWTSEAFANLEPDAERAFRLILSATYFASTSLGLSPQNAAREWLCEQQKLFLDAGFNPIRLVSLDTDDVLNLGQQHVKQD